VTSQPIISGNHASFVMEPVYIQTVEGWRSMQDIEEACKLVQGDASDDKQRPAMSEAAWKHV